MSKFGYHLTNNIEKGIFGEISKVDEEYQELNDALVQENPIMVLTECSDLIGAIAGYTEKHYNVNLEDLIKMVKATERAFKSGKRT